LNIAIIPKNSCESDLVFENSISFKHEDKKQLSYSSDVIDEQEVITFKIPD